MEFDGLSPEQRLEIYQHAARRCSAMEMPHFETGSWEWDPKSGFVLWSKTTYELLGIEPGTGMPSTELLISLIHPDDREYFARKNAEAEQTDTAPPLEYRIIQPDGQVRKLRARGGARHDANGNVTHLMGTVTDITGDTGPEALSSIEVIDRRIRLHEPERGGGAFAVFLRRRCQLSLLRFSLLEALRERHQLDMALAESARGFIPSIELLTTLPWDTPRPSPENLKQVIRHTRELLKSTGLLIEAKRGLGYRLWFTEMNPTPEN